MTEVSIHKVFRAGEAVRSVTVRVPVNGGLLVTFSGRLGALRATNRAYDPRSPATQKQVLSDEVPWIPKPWFGHARRAAEAVFGGKRTKTSDVSVPKEEASRTRQLDLFA